MFSPSEKNNLKQEAKKAETHAASAKLLFTISEGNFEEAHRMINEASPEVLTHKVMGHSPLKKMMIEISNPSTPPELNDEYKKIIVAIAGKLTAEQIAKEIGFLNANRVDKIVKEAAALGSKAEAAPAETIAVSGSIIRENPLTIDNNKQPRLH